MYLPSLLWTTINAHNSSEKGGKLVCTKILKQKRLHIPPTCAVFLRKLQSGDSVYSAKHRNLHFSYNLLLTGHCAQRVKMLSRL